MLTIQSVMLVALGFFGAWLLALLLAPAFWKRAVRLTTERLKRSLPVSEMEIRADRDRLRADFAMQIYRLEQQVERGKLASARHMVEVSRREAANGAMATQLRKLEAEMAEARNARNVLEHTVTDRLPQIESRLSEARNLLGERNQEIEDLKAIGAQQHHALEAAHDMHSQQLAEIQRLTAQLATAGAANTGATSDDRFDGEVALRSEIEALRAQAREQSALIERLRASTTVDDTTTGASSDAGADRTARLARSLHDAEVERLRNALDEAQSALMTARDGTGADAGRTNLAHDQELQGLRAHAEAQAAELMRLRVALDTHERSDAETLSGGIRESKLTLKARLDAADAVTERQQRTIDKLNADLQAATERLARQSEYFAAELKRIGAGTLQAGFDHPLPARTTGTHISLAERVSRARMEPRSEASERDRKVVELPSSSANGNAEPAAGYGSERREASSSNGAAKTGGASDQTRRPKLLERISSLSEN